MPSEKCVFRLRNISKRKQASGKKTCRTLFKTPKQNCMRNLKRFWQSSILHKIPNALFQPNPSIIIITLLFSLSTTTMSGLLASITWSHGMIMSHNILHQSFLPHHSVDDHTISHFCSSHTYNRASSGPTWQYGRVLSCTLSVTGTYIH